MTPLACARGSDRSARRSPPWLQKTDAHGNYPAVDYARASLARNIIGKRVEAGLIQRERYALADDEIGIVEEATQG